MPYTELPAGSSDSPIASEWNLYLREVQRLLAEGHENRWVLIEGEETIGIWDTEEEARAVALTKFLMQPCLIHRFAAVNQSSVCQRGFGDVKKLVFPVLPDGLLVDVLIGVDGDTLVALMAAGQPIPGRGEPVERSTQAPT